MENPVHRRNELFAQLANLLAPVERLLALDRPAEQDAARARAQVTRDLPAFLERVHDFTETGDAGGRYETERVRISAVLYFLMKRLEAAVGSRDKLAGALEAAREEVEEQLSLLPVELPLVELRRKTPFQAYLLLNALFESARKRVWFADPHMDRSVFHRYLASVPARAGVCLVTTCDGPRDEPRLDALADVCRLFAADRERPKVRLVRTDAAFEALLIVDKHAYDLGEAVQDAAAATPYRIAPAADAKDALRAFKHLVAEGADVS